MNSWKPCIRRALAAVGATALALSVLALPSAVSADTESDAHPHTGVSIGGNATYFHGNKGTADGWYGGADLRLQFAPALALEGSVNYQQDRSIDYYPVQASLLVYLTPQYRLSPYILGGGTWYLQSGPGNMGNSFGPHAGAGLELYLSRDWSIDSSWRYMWLQNTGTGTNYFNRSYSSNTWMVQSGLHYHF